MTPTATEIANCGRLRVRRGTPGGGDSMLWLRLVTFIQMADTKVMIEFAFTSTTVDTKNSA